ncbi:MAG: hypothetical protein CMJ23_00985 [Phycisphaerae bacterium]|nr:hypothetical protein [Phycisphaerae bacterium]
MERLRASTVGRGIPGRRPNDDPDNQSGMLPKKPTLTPPSSAAFTWGGQIEGSGIRIPVR